MIKNIFSCSKMLAKSFTNIMKYPISHKLTYGQGGTCQLSLTKRQYRIEFETIWEDHGTVEIQTDQNIIVYENMNKSVILDQQLLENEDIVEIKLKLPEDYTLQGNIKGTFLQIKNPLTTNKLRSTNTKLNLIDCSVSRLQLLDLTVINFQLQALTAQINLNKITAESLNLSCREFSSEKIMISKNLYIIAQKIKIRSLILYGNSLAKFETKQFSAESISGCVNIKTEKLTINRFYQSLTSTNNEKKTIIQAKQIALFVIQTGYPVIIVQKEECIQNIKLGKMHKGKIIVTQFSDKWKIQIN